MATGPQFIAALAPVTGMHTSTLVRYFQEIRNAKLIPTSGKGGGKVAVHLNATNAASILLALCARGPGRAVHTARQAAGLPNASPGRPEEKASNLISELTDTILTGEIAEGWSMVIDSNPLSASITDGNGSTKLFSHGPEFTTGRPRHFRLGCHVEGGVLAVLARLVAEVPA